jgi:hypothetical protein
MMDEKSSGHCTRFFLGMNLRFGSIVINRRGISGVLSGKSTVTVPWTAIQRYNICGGEIVILTKSQTYLSFQTKRIPNLPVFMHVLEQMLGARSSEGRLTKEKN